MIVQVFIRNIDTTPKEGKRYRNNYAIALLYDKWAQRNLDWRGMSYNNLVIQRNASDQEVKENQHPFRMTYYKYYGWKEFLDDEMRVLKADETDPYIAKLLEIKKSNRFSLIPERDPAPDNNIKEEDLQIKKPSSVQGDLFRK